MDEKQSKITKKDFSEYLKSLIGNTVPKSGEELMQFVATQSFHFLAENYSNMDNEMQALADKMLDDFEKHIGAALKEAPDTKEIREAKRLFRSMQGKLPSASSLIISLESKSGINEPLITETRGLFQQYFQSYLDFLYDISVAETHHGIPSFAKLSSLFSMVDELLAAFHMAQHGYVNQAYAHLRTAHESIDQIALFIRDEHYAEVWYSDDEKAKMNKLKPAAVRQKLGIKNDPFYAFLSAYGSHVTKEYVQSRSAKKSELNQTGNPEIHFFIGGTRTTFHLLWANVGCILLLFAAFIHLGKAFPDRVHGQDFVALIKTYARDFMVYIERFTQFFKEAGINTKQIEDLLNVIDQLLRDVKSS